MSGPSKGDRLIEATASAAPEDRIQALSTYFVAHSHRYKPKFLREAAAKAGYSPEDIEEAWHRSAAITDARQEAFRPIRSRARWIVLASYVLVFAGLVILLLGPGFQYGSGVLAIAILTPVMLIALAASIGWVNRRRSASTALEGALGTILIVPVVLLVTVAGLCVASTQSLRGPY
jgi:hypothetical protein